MQRSQLPRSLPLRLAAHYVVKITLITLGPNVAITVRPDQLRVDPDMLSVPQDRPFDQCINSQFAANFSNDFLLPLNCMDDVREITRSDLICAKFVINASVMPSEKNSWEGSSEDLQGSRD